MMRGPRDSPGASAYLFPLRAAFDSLFTSGCGPGATPLVTVLYLSNAAFFQNDSVPPR